MGKVVAYLPASGDEEYLDWCSNEIDAYAHGNDLLVEEYIEGVPAVGGDAIPQSAAMLIDRLEPGDQLIVKEIGHLGQSSSEALLLLDCLLSAFITVSIVQPQITLRRHSKDALVRVVAELIACLAALDVPVWQGLSTDVRAVVRTSANRSENRIPRRGSVGKPKGTIQSSMYDQDRDRIVELLRMGVSQRRIVERHLGYGTANSLNYYIKSRGILSSPKLEQPGSQCSS